MRGGGRPRRWRPLVFEQSRTLRLDPLLSKSLLELRIKSSALASQPTSVYAPQLVCCGILNRTAPLGISMLPHEPVYLLDQTLLPRDGYFGDAHDGSDVIIKHRTAPTCSFYTNLERRSPIGLG